MCNASAVVKKREARLPSFQHDYFDFASLFYFRIPRFSVFNENGKLATMAFKIGDIYYCGRMQFREKHVGSRAGITLAWQR